MADEPKTTRRRRIAAAAAVALMAVSGAGCARQDNPASEAQQVDLKIVAQTPIDENGKEVKLDTGGTPVTAGGDLSLIHI